GLCTLGRDLAITTEIAPAAFGFQVRAGDVAGAPARVRQRAGNWAATIMSLAVRHPGPLVDQPFLGRAAKPKYVGLGLTYSRILRIHRIRPDIGESDEMLKYRNR